MIVDEKNTIDNLSSLYVPLLCEIQLDKFPKSTRVIVINGFCISKSLQDWTEMNRKINLQDRVKEQSAKINIELMLNP